MKTSKKIHSIWKALQLMCTKLSRIFWGRYLSYFVYGVVFQVISQKTLCSKDFGKNLRGFLYENNRNYNSFKFIYKFIFICFSSFRRNERQESNFWQVSGLVTRNISVLFKRNRALLQSYAEFKRILIHVIPARIIVPWYDGVSILRYGFDFLWTTEEWHFIKVDFYLFWKQQRVLQNPKRPILYFAPLHKRIEKKFEFWFSLIELMEK